MKAIPLDIIRLNKVLADYFIRGKVVDFVVGNSVIQYKVKLEDGERVANLLKYSKEIALAVQNEEPTFSLLSAEGFVGIDLPRKDRQIVLYNALPAATELLDIPVGFTVDNTLVTLNLPKMPHLLVAGATGSGKSNLLNLMVYSIIKSWDPSQIKLYLIDTKRVEFAMFSGHPDIQKIAFEVNTAESILREVSNEMEKRFQSFQKDGMRNITDYKINKFPRIVVIIDELADLVLQKEGSRIEQALCRIAQKGRAVGVYLIAATQRPSIDIISGLIKANFPSRIAFKVASEVDSRVILDEGGAERLLGLGDMLYRASYDNPSTSSIRVQCAYLPNEAIKAIVPEPEIEVEEIEEIKVDYNPLHSEDYLKVKAAVKELKVFNFVSLTNILKDENSIFRINPLSQIILFHWLYDMKNEGYVEKCDAEKDKNIIIDCARKNKFYWAYACSVPNRDGFWKIKEGANNGE